MGKNNTIYSLQITLNLLEMFSLCVYGLEMINDPNSEKSKPFPRVVTFIFFLMQRMTELDCQLELAIAPPPPPPPNQVRKVGQIWK